MVIEGLRSHFGLSRNYLGPSLIMITQPVGCGASSVAICFKVDSSDACKGQGSSPVPQIMSPSWHVSRSLFRVANLSAIKVANFAGWLFMSLVFVLSSLLYCAVTWRCRSSVLGDSSSNSTAEVAYLGGSSSSDTFGARPGLSNTLRDTAAPCFPNVRNESITSCKNIHVLS